MSRNILHIHSLSTSMVRTINFKEVYEKLTRTLQQCGNAMTDVDLMENLGFSPHSWKVWKPKLKERADLSRIKHSDSEADKEVEYGVFYDKKSKMWTSLFPPQP